MTATERLRQLLDERGVEWDYGITGPATTRFNASGIDVTFTPMLDGLVCSTILTPEQAVEATLGRGTCKMKRVEDEQRILHGWLECSECGPVYPPVSDRIAQAVAFCPFCGRKVVE